MSKSSDFELALEKMALYEALGRFCEAIDRCDFHTAIQLFTTDCVTDFGPFRGGAIQGRDAFFARMVANQRSFKRAHHQLGQMVADVRGSVASTVTYLDAAIERLDGVRYDHHMQYHDEWVKTDDKEWRIRRRRAVSTVIDGFPELHAGANWLVRAE